MWWLDSEDWTALYDTIKIGTSYSQETIQFVRLFSNSFPFDCAASTAPALRFTYFLFPQALLLGPGAASRVGVVGGIHPDAGRNQKYYQLPGHRVADHVPVPRQVPGREAAQGVGNAAGPKPGGG